MEIVNGVNAVASLYWIIESSTGMAGTTLSPDGRTAGHPMTSSRVKGHQANHWLANKTKLPLDVL